jgi:hypothetical protein
VLNSCHTGGTRSYGGQREDLAWNFLELGAIVVIASPLNVNDTMGMHFGKNLYKNSSNLGNHHFGQAFLMARNSIEKQFRKTTQWPMWSLLTYHGNPYAKLPNSNGNYIKNIGGTC